jgi:TldD protein
MQKDLADFSVKYALKKGASYAEARLEQIEGSGFILKNGNPEVSGFDSVAGLGVRLLLKNTLGFVAINNLKKEEIKKLIDSSIKLTENSSKIGEKINFSEEPKINFSYEVKQKIKLKDKDPEEKLNILQEVDDEIKDLPGRYLTLSDFLTKKYFVNSEGAKITSKIPRINFVYFLTITEKQKALQRYLQYGSTSGYECLKKWKLTENILNEVKALKNNLKKGVKPPKGVLDVITAPEVTGIIAHESGGHPYEADRIFGREAAQAGESFITPDLLNTKIGSDEVSVVDDPTIENSYGFYLYDDEGVKARRKFLMKNGHINGFLHNRSTAFKMNMKSNGSARACIYNVEPIIRMSNTFILPGNYSEEELIEDIKLGVYIKNFTEWNIDDKRISQKYVGAEAYLIKNGKLSIPVTNPVIELTTKALYSSIDAVGKNLGFVSATCGKGEPMQGIPVFTGGPSIRLRKIRIR